MAIDWRRVARDALIVWATTLLGGLVVGFSFGVQGATQSSKMVVALAFTSVVFHIVAFAIVGLLTKVDRLRHLSVVVVAVWLLNVFNILLFGLTVIQWALSLAFIAIFALVGCSIGFLISHLSRKRAE